MTDDEKTKLIKEMGVKLYFLKYKGYPYAHSLYVSANELIII